MGFSPSDLHERHHDAPADDLGTPIFDALVRGWDRAAHPDPVAGGRHAVRQALRVVDPSGATRARRRRRYAWPGPTRDVGA